MATPMLVVFLNELSAAGRMQKSEQRQQILHGRLPRQQKPLLSKSSQSRKRSSGGRPSPQDTACQGLSIEFIRKLHVKSRLKDLAGLDFAICAGLQKRR